MTSARAYCPYSSGPRSRATTMVAMAEMRVARMLPEIRKKPPRAESSAILSSSVDIAVPCRLLFFH